MLLDDTEAGAATTSQKKLFGVWGLGFGEAGFSLVASGAKTALNPQSSSTGNGICSIQAAFGHGPVAIHAELSDAWLARLGGSRS